MTDQLARLLVDSACILGEAPLWVPEAGCLYWLDIEAQRLWRLRPGEAAASLPLPGPASFLVRASSGKLIAGMDRGFVLLDPAEGRVRSLCEPLAAPEGTMMNDGKADRQGRIVGGAKDRGERSPAAPAFRLDAAGLRAFPGAYTVFNGPAFSPDGSRIYFADSPSKVIQTAGYDPESGEVGRPEPFAVLGPDEGYPDGMTVDCNGGLWNAQWDGWRITRYHPGGERDRSVALPVPRPTSLAFGGAGFETLFITTARSRLDPESLAAAPLSGGLFALEPGERGLEEACVPLVPPLAAWSGEARRCA